MKANNKMRLIIDCDPGNGVPGANVDDGLALALALLSPSINIELISIVAGNTPVNVGYAVAHTLLQQTHQTIALSAGAARPLLEPMAGWREHLDHSVDKHHLRALWQQVPLPEPCPVAAPLAPYLIGDIICRNPGEIILVAIGPLTNVALAMQLFPALANSVKRIVIMGGVFQVAGYRKDTNFGIDPEAAHVVLTSGAPITLLPLDVTTQTQLLHKNLDRIARINTPLTHYLAQTLRPWLDYSSRTRQLPGCWIHDALTIAWLLEPELCSSEDDYVDVALTGIARGMSCRSAGNSLRLPVGVPAHQGAPVQILHSVNNQKLLSLMMQLLENGR